MENGPSRKPPTRFVRKSRKNERNDSVAPALNSEAAGRPDQAPLNATKETKSFNRSEYNRLIGEMIRKDFEFHCDDLPTMDQIACFQEIDPILAEKKK
jgi:hypothetical protein